MKVTITDVLAREILDSRGRPTVEAELGLSDGTRAVASVPSGASTGRHEAVERRDGDATRYGGRGVLGAVAAVRGEIADMLVGRVLDQGEVDAALCELDGTPNKSRLGANAILAVSLVAARAGAAAAGVPLWAYLANGTNVTMPLPMVNILSGGLHAGRQLDFQDFLVIPVGADTYSQALEMAVAVHAATGTILEERGITTLRADEGGFGPSFADHGAALELLDMAVERAGLTVGEDIAYALDVAASQFFTEADSRYHLLSEARNLTGDELATYICELVDTHAIVSVEDPFAEDDWAQWARFTERRGDGLQIVGDDLFTTNIGRLNRGIKEHSANAILIKMNQIGTITETLDVVTRAKQAGFRIVVSARSGETEDTALADLAVATAAGQIKIGSVTQSERLAKYNQLLRIDQQLAGDSVLARWG